MAGGHVWQERQPLKWVVRILLERILVITIGIGSGPSGVVFTVICVNKLIGVMIT